MRSSILLVCLLALISMLSGCDISAEARTQPPQNTEVTSTDTSKATANTDDKSIPRVEVRTVETGSLTEHTTFRGKTDAIRAVTLSAEAAGRLEVFSLELGDKVKQNDTIARVDYRMLNAQVRQAKAAYNLASATYDRQKELQKDRMTTPQQVDQAEAQKLQAKAALELAEVNLQHATVRSSIAGTVVSKFVEKGEYVSPGKPLVKILDLSSVEITTQIPESQVSRVKAGMKVNVNIPALNETFQGQIRVVLPQANASSNTFEARITVPNRDGRILIGMATTVQVELQNHQNVVIIPQDYVISNGLERVVFIEKDGVAYRRPVTLGATEGDRVVITQGLSAGERIITQGQRDLRDGQVVKTVSSSKPNKANL